MRAQQLENWFNQRAIHKVNKEQGQGVVHGAAPTSGQNVANPRCLPPSPLAPRLVPQPSALPRVALDSRDAPSALHETAPRPPQSI